MRNAAIIVGAAIALVILLAVAIPPLIDWSKYKGEIVARVGAATGRPVDITGTVGLGLLPSPALSAQGVTIGNPGGAPGELARIERLRIELAALPLLTGTVRLRTLELDHPVVTLTRLPDGRPNWRGAAGQAESAPAPETTAPPQRRAARPEPPPAETADEALPVQDVRIRHGEIHYGGSLHLTGLDIQVALGGRSGPFRADGSAKLGNVAVALEGVVERLSPGRASPASLSLRLPGEDAGAEFSGLLSQLSGGETLRGHLTAKAADPGRTLARMGLTPSLPPGALAAEGDLSLSNDEASLANLAVALGDTRATGSIAAALGATPQVDVRLATTALNLDQWVQAKSAATPAVTPAAPAPAPSQPTAPAGQAAPAATPAAPGNFSLPRDVFGSATLSADRVTWHGQMIRQARIEAALDQGELMLRQVAARLPGDSDAEADGTLSAESGAPLFDGRVRVKSANAAALLAWLGLHGSKDSLPRSLELASPLRLAWPEVRLDGFRLIVDGTQARGSAAARVEDNPALALQAALEGMEVSLKGRLLDGGRRVEDGAFKLTSAQGLKPLRNFGIKVPGALERLGALTAEGTASGTLDALAVDARADSGGVTLTTRGTLAHLDGEPRGDLAVQARAASTAQVARLFGDGKAQGGGAFALDARVAGTARAVDVSGLTLRAGPSSLGGQGHADLGGAKPVITADLTAETLALDRLLGGERTGQLLPGGGHLLPPTLAPQSSAVVPVAMVGAGGSPFSREPLDLSALNAFDARIALRAQTITAKAWRLDNAATQVALQGGTATVERLTGKLLGGEVSATAKLAAGPTPALSGQFAVTGADVGALGFGGGGITVTQGRMDADGRFATTGRSSQDMAGRLTGDGKLLVRNGVVDGFDLPAVNRQLGNVQNLGSLLGVVQAGLAGGRTPFTQLAGTWRASDGIVTSRDLRLDAEGGGATADTQVNLPDWSTRTTIAFHLANAPQTPLTARLEGPLENPRKIIDVNAIQQYLVAQGLGRALKGKTPPSGDQPQQSEQPREKNTGKNILKNLLKGLGGQ